MRRVCVSMLAVMTWVAPNAASVVEAGDHEVRYHRGWTAYVRDGMMYGYPGARYWAECPHPPGPYYGGTNYWYPPHVSPWPNGPGMSGFGYSCACGPYSFGNCGNGDGMGGGGTPSYGGYYESVPDKAGMPTNSFLLNLRVPEDAVVYVNGQRTGMTGRDRTFRTEKLEPGLQYTYEIRAEYPIDGQMVTKTETILARPGEVKTVSFKTKSQESQQGVAAIPAARSTLALRVPEEARVYVNGRMMQSTGSTRVFATTVPTNGSKRAEYDIRVELDSGEHVLVREETVSLVAGATRDLTIDFNNAQVSQKQSTQR